jgi:hypothetical protein
MKDLFGNEVLQIPGAGDKKDRIAIRQYKQLTNLYGIIADKRCKQCVHCKLHQHGSERIYKCHLAKISHSPATDWNSFWTACGKFEPEKG